MFGIRVTKHSSESEKSPKASHRHSYVKEQKHKLWNIYEMLCFFLLIAGRVKCKRHFIKNSSVQPFRATIAYRTNKQLTQTRPQIFVHAQCTDAKVINRLASKWTHSVRIKCYMNYQSKGNDPVSRLSSHSLPDTSTLTAISARKTQYEESVASQRTIDSQTHVHHPRMQPAPMRPSQDREPKLINDRYLSRKW